MNVAPHSRPASATRPGGEMPPRGLSSEEARRLLAEDGPNELAEEARHPLKELLGYFWAPIPWMIEAALILSAVVAHWVDFTIILVLLLANAVVGYWEESQAGNAIAALRAHLAINARANRDGEWTVVPARELVTGDLIRLRGGDIVPADAELIDSDPVEADQSSLTGESLPVSRGPGDTIYSGSVLTRGETTATVTATGARTYFGKTAELVEKGHSTSHFQKAVLRIGNYLIGIAVALVLVILTTALLRHDSLMSTLQFGLVLTVAAIPVAMPTVLSVTMAVGARLLARKQAIVSRLAAVEELAGVDVLCCDKTGTLTQNTLTLADPHLMDGVTRDQILQNAALASRAENQDPIDRAILESWTAPENAVAYETLRFEPFDPVRKRTEATVRTEDGQTFKVTKGAPQVIVDLLAERSAVEDDVREAIDAFAGRGFRSLAVAHTDPATAGSDDAEHWTLDGILPLYDPPREDSRETIARAAAEGVTVKLITGDQVAIAREIASRVGMGTRILDADLFSEAETHSGSRLDETIESADGFAQVFPEHKYRIIENLQRRGHIVGMTGDGVNDAPALERADAGIAVAGAADAARAAASIVLLTPGLSVITDAISESRKIFRRMTSYATYRIAETLRVLLFMALSILVFNFYPVTAVMIVLLALLNDGAILSIAYDNAHPGTQPEAWDMRTVLGVATALGLTGLIGSFGLFVLAERTFHLAAPVVQSLMYLKLSVAGHLTIFVTRTRGPFWSERPSRALLSAVVGTQILATLIAVYGALMTPIGWPMALAVWAYALVWFVIEDRVKLAAHRILSTRRVASVGTDGRRYPTAAEEC